MGYTHYWDRPQTISEVLWSRIRGDFEKLILPLSDARIELAGGLGTGPPEITDAVICFTVRKSVTIRKRGLVIPYPSIDAEGVVPVQQQSTATSMDLASL